MKKVSIFLFIIIITLSLTGCWGKKELDEISLISGLAIDPSEKGYLISVQVMVPGEITGETRSAASNARMFSEEGESIFQAIRKLTMKMPRKAYFTHLMVIIINEEVAKDNMLEIIDLCLRDTEIRPDVPIIISKDDMARDILKSVTHIENIPANKVKKTGTNMNENWTATKTITLLNLFNAMASDGVNPTLIGATVVGDEKEGETTKNVEDIESPAMIELRYFSVFKNNKLIGWLDEDESRGYSYLIGEIHSSIMTVPCDEYNTYNLEIYSFKTKEDVKIKEGKPVVYIDYYIVTNVGEIGCSINLKNMDEVKKLESIFEEEVIENSYYTIEQLQIKYQSDIVGFGEMIHRKEPKIWKALKEDWDSHFENLEVVIDAKVKIRRPGTIRGQIIDEIIK